MKLLGYWFNVIAVAVLLNISYYATLSQLNNKKFKVFNYDLIVWKGNIHVIDRINKIERKQRAQDR